MTPLRRFVTGIAPCFVFAACAQIIGLSDYDTGEAHEAGGGGEGASGGNTSQGGSSGTGVKPAEGGEEAGGSAGVLGGRPGRGGQSGDGGAAGEAAGGEPGTGGTMATGGATTGGTVGSGGAGGSGGSGGSSAGGGSGGTGGSQPCTEITLPSFVDRVVDVSSAAYGFEIDPELGASFPDLFQLQFYDDGGDFDGSATGIFMLGAGGFDSNYAICSRCLLAFQDEGEIREKIFFQTGGTLRVDASSAHMDGFPNYTLSDVTLREVTIDGQSNSTLVPGGDCLHIESQTYSISPPPDWDCELRWYVDDDCDCGCAELDPKCTDAMSSTCDYCWCNDVNGLCSTEEVSSTENWTCN